jgi:TonB-linked SusC/RagA family outer membrane protein
MNVRHDGSSRMPKANRYATFPSVSVGWVFSNEQFMEKYDFLSMGKLRFSWGKLGNQEIGNYAFMATLGASGNYFFNQSDDKQAGMVQTSVPNEKIKWETTSSVNVGLDLGFFNNRIQTTFEWFDKKTSDILMRLAMPGIFLGSLAAPYQNVGAVRNRGWEWNLNYSDSRGDWSWNVGFSLSKVKNEIQEMGGLEETISGNTINRIGEPIGAYFGYKAIGLYRTEEDLQRTNSQGEVIKQNGVAPKLGDIMYADLNDDGNITAEDRDIIGNPFPELSYGISMGASWKNFDFTAFWQGVSGIYRYSWETTTDIRGNFTDRWLNRYSAENPNGSMPALGNTMNDSYSSFWLEKSDYLRLKNVELGYTFRQPFLAKAGISSIRLYLAGTNLLTFTPLKHWDPEKGSGDTRNDVHPNMRTYSIGVNVQF